MVSQVSLESRRVSPASSIRCALNAWSLLITDRKTAGEQMALDEQLAQAACPTLRLFRWHAPAVSCGLKQPLPMWVDRDALAAWGVELVERPTGGGLALHGSDVSFSIVAPRDARLPLHAITALVSESLVHAVGSVGVLARWLDEPAGSARIAYCLMEKSPYALMLGTRKLCGLAIRRYPSSWLLQGSLLVRRLPAVFETLMPREVSEGFRTHAIALEDAAGRQIADDELIAAVLKAWRTTWNIPINFASQNL